MARQCSAILLVNVELKSIMLSVATMVPFVYYDECFHHIRRLLFVYRQRENCVCVTGRDLCSFPFMYCMCERVYCTYRVHEEQSVLFCFQAQYLLVEIRLYSALGIWDLYQTSLCAEDQILCVCSAPPRWHRMIVAQLSTLCGHTRTHLPLYMSGATCLIYLTQTDASLQCKQNALDYLCCLPGI